MSDLPNQPLRCSPRATAWGWGVLGLMLLVQSGALAWLSKDFTYGTDLGSRPILALVAVLMAAGAVYLGAVALVRRSAPSRGLAWWIFGVGAAMRLIAASTQPLLEDDYYRYLWDGAVAAHGYNPYAIIPGVALSGGYGAESGIPELAEEAGIVLERVNHPNLGTIYPPATQVAFALAHRLVPWKLSGLRAVYYGVDCVVFALLLGLLRRLGRPARYSVLYWWNPLVVEEVYNSLHMDILLVPCVLGAVLFLFQQRPGRAAAALALAAAVKLWPLILLPPALATCWRTPRKMAAAAGIFAGLTVLFLAPMYPIIDLGGNSGLVVYGERWEMNDALFMAFPWLLEQAASIAGFALSPGELHRGGKVLAALILIAITLWVCRAIARREPPHAPLPVSGTAAYNRWIAAKLCAIAAALFLLSPTQFPWYYLWLLPMLVLAPSNALLWLTALLPLYYLKFYLDARGQVDFFHNRIVWVEFAPVWLLLGREWWSRRRGRRAPGVEVDV